MRLLYSLFTLGLLTLNGIQSLRGSLVDLKATTLEEESDSPVIQPTNIPTEFQPSSIPTEIPINANGAGATCRPFWLNSGDTKTCQIQYCGGSLTITQCPYGFVGDTTFGSPSCSGTDGTKLQLYHNDVLLASDDQQSGRCGCAEIVYTLDENNGCRWYEVVQSCDGYNQCDGATAVFTTPTNNDDALVGNVITAAGAGGICEAFSIDPYSDFDIACQFEACAPFVITQCWGDGFESDGGAIPHPSGSVNNLIELYEVGGTTLLASDQDSGPCSAPKISYTPTQSGCTTYKVRQTCAAGVTSCGGRTAIYTPTVIDATTGGLCEEFSLTFINGWAPAYCDFEACDGETVVMSTCSDGTAYCSSDGVELTLLDGAMVITSGTVGGCGCPKIVHTFSGPCRTYRVRQQGIFPETDVQGLTRIRLLTGTDDDTVVVDNDDAVVGTPVTAAGAGGICDAFSIDQNSDQDIVCHFEACAAFVITQCTGDGFVSDGVSIPHPSGSSSNRIELYSMNDPSMLLTFDQGSGPCMAPKISFTSTETGCITYKIRQTCASGATSCNGRTAVFTPTVATIVDADIGGVCDEFFIDFNNNWQPVVCEFTACPGTSVTISQCQTSGPSGEAYCSGAGEVYILLTKSTGEYVGYSDGSACGCPKMTYTFAESCQTYSVLQDCALSGADCRGQTAIVPAALIDDDDAIDDGDDEVADISAEGTGDVCTAFTLGPADEQICLFRSCGGLVTITQCADTYASGGTPSCSSNSKLTLTVNGLYRGQDESSGLCGCPQIVAPLDSVCRTYTITQSCADGINGCSGATAVFTTASTLVDADSNGGGLCEPFNVNNGYGAQTCAFQSCGGLVTISQCSQGYDGTGMPTCSAGTYLELSVPNGEPMFSDDGTGPCGCPEILYKLPFYCQTYHVKQRCVDGEQNCAGATAVFTAPPIDADSNGGAVCEPYQVVGGVGQRLCYFRSCGGPVTVSQCTENYTGAGAPTCTGTTRLVLFDGDTNILGTDQSSGFCGCSEVTYNLPLGCETYQVYQSCADGGQNCGGTTAVFTAPSLDVDNGPALCDPYELVDGVGQQSCWFTSCGGPVFITQCATDYPGLGMPTCSNNTYLELHVPNLGNVQSDYNGGSCGCSEIVYTLPLVCQTYEVVQGCVDPNCAATTAVYTVSSLDVDNAPGICDPFAVVDGVGQQSCWFTSCGGNVIVTQCAAQFAGSGAGVPTCSGDTRLEVYLNGNSYSYDEGSGLCGCSHLEFSADQGVCNTYEIRQSCADGVTDCSGTTGFFALSAPTEAVCDSYVISSSGGPSFYVCEFESCGGPVTITQCNNGYSGTCVSGNMLQLYFEEELLASAVSGDGSGSCACPTINLSLNAVCETYQLVQTCTNGNCQGETVVFSTPGVLPYVSPDGAGGLCESYAYNNGDGARSCEFVSCGGPVTISQCSEGYTGLGTPSCTGDTRLELYVNGVFTQMDQGGGTCGCSTILYAGGVEGVCKFFSVVQYCADGVNECSGTTAVFATPVVTAPIDLDVAEGLCQPFDIVRGGQQTCQFTSCGGSVTVSQCPGNYNGTGTPTCSGNTFLELVLPGGGSLASSEGSGSCGCSEIVYTLPETCQTYEVVQGCADGGQICSGATAVYVTATTDDVNPTDAVCTAFVTTARDGPPFHLCEFESCGGSVTITQCAEGYTGLGNPMCLSSTTLELYFQEGLLASATSGDGTGPCGCPTLVYTLPDSCETFQLIQDCVAGDCSGQTVVFSTPANIPAPVITPVVSPTVAPTSYSTVPHTYTVRNGFAFAVPTGAGDLFTLGEDPHGGLMPGDVGFNSFASPVNYIVASRFAFVAVLVDQTYVSWGAASALAGVAVDHIHSLVANEAAFAGINVATGGVVAMGSKHNGGNVLDNARCNGFATQLSSAVLSVVASSCSFTAIKIDGSVYTWGNTHCGGGISSETRTDLVNVQKVFATREAFVAILPGGVVKTWGGAYAGGSTANVLAELGAATVVDIFAGKSVFVAHTATGGLIAWGYGPHGGDLSAMQANVNSNVVHVTFTFTACAALKSNGDVYVWGRADSGGDASSVAGGLHNIVLLYGNNKAFAAVTTTGSVVTWGKAEFGGAIPAEKLADLSSGVVAIFHTDRAFAALKDTGQLVVWGQAGHGGSPSPAVEALLLSGVYAVYANDVAFAAVKEDGSVVAWGHPVSVPVPGVQLVSELLQ